MAQGIGRFSQETRKVSITIEEERAIGTDFLIIIEYYSSEPNTCTVGHYMNVSTLYYITSRQRLLYKRASCFSHILLPALFITL